MKKSKGQIEYEKKFNRIAQKLYGNQANLIQKEPEKEFTTQQKVTKNQRSGINNDVMQKSNTNKKNIVSNIGKLLNEDLEKKEVPKEVATKVSKARNYRKLTLKEYLNQEEKNEDENNKTKAEKIEVFDNTKEKKNKVVEKQEIIEKKDPEQKEEEVDEKEATERKDKIVDDKIGNMMPDLLNCDEAKNDVSSDDEIINIIQDVLNNEVIKDAVSKNNEDINNLINSNKFKFMGNLHQQIITGAENGNSIYNRFEIDNNIANNYKQYSEQLTNFLIIYFHEKLSNIILDDYSSRIGQIEKIITDIYTKLYGMDELKDIEDKMKVFLDESINSDENLKGKNILKILANLACVIYYFSQNCHYAILLLAFGEKISIFNQIIMDNHILFEVIIQFQTIIKLFGIETN